MIKLENIEKNYLSGEIETKALVDINFNIKKGEFVAIIGPSGSGKSTLMNILGCLDTPTSGKYYLDNSYVAKLSDDELAEIRRKKIGFVFQSFNLLPRSTVLRNVVLPLIYDNVDKHEREKIAAKALSDAGLEKKFFTHLSNQLSGGQMQRVAIARSLVNNPAIILADEPTGNLDSHTGELVLETFKKLNEKGKTIILITHERYIASKAKRVISIKDGRIIEDYINPKCDQINFVRE